MTASLMRVRWLTSATVRPACPRASASASPTRTPRLHCSTQLHASRLRGAGGHDHIITAMPAAELTQSGAVVPKGGGLAALTQTHPYQAEAAVTFLDHAPDQERVESLGTRVGQLVRDQGLFLDPAHPEAARLAPGYAPGEFHLACDYAIRPTSVGRGWFTDAEFARSLDALAAAQQDDGGWPINWAQWSPIAASESRPAVTTLALLTLRAYDAPGAS